MSPYICPLVCCFLSIFVKVFLHFYLFLYFVFYSYFAFSLLFIVSFYFFVVSFLVSFVLSNILLFLMIYIILIVLVTIFIYHSLSHSGADLICSLSLIAPSPFSILTLGVICSNLAWDDLIILQVWVNKVNSIEFLLVLGPQLGENLYMGLATVLRTGPIFVSTQSRFWKQEHIRREQPEGFESWIGKFAYRWTKLEYYYS